MPPLHLVREVRPVLVVKSGPFFLFFATLLATFNRAILHAKKEDPAIPCPNEPFFMRGPSGPFGTARPHNEGPHDEDTKLAPFYYGHYTIGAIVAARFYRYRAMWPAYGTRSCALAAWATYAPKEVQRLTGTLAVA